MMRTAIVTAGSVFALMLGLAANNPAAALTSKECSAKYKQAQTAGTTGGLKYADYRKKECGPGASPAAAATTTTTTTPTTTPAPRPTAAKEQPAATGGSSAAVFPTAISPKFSSEKPGRARLHTCSEQYQANKATNANGGMKWIQKGGGYWSECNKHLKG